MGSLKRKVNQLNPPGTQGTLWAYYPRTRGPKPILGQQGGPNHKAVNLLSFSYSLRLVRGYKQTSTQCTNLHFLTICRALLITCSQMIKLLSLTPLNQLDLSWWLLFILLIFGGFNGKHARVSRDNSLLFYRKKFQENVSCEKWVFVFG